MIEKMEEQRGNDDKDYREAHRLFRIVRRKNGCMITQVIAKEEKRQCRTAAVDKIGQLNPLIGQEQAEQTDDKGQDSKEKMAMLETFGNEIQQVKEHVDFKQAEEKPDGRIADDPL